VYPQNQNPDPLIGLKSLDSVYICFVAVVSAETWPVVRTLSVEKGVRGLA